MSECPFCRPDPSRIVWRGQYVNVLWDGHPVSPGHALVVPRRHVANWFALFLVEQHEVLDGIAKARTAITDRHGLIDGWNLGVNVGGAGGQTVMHAHLHVIPRHCGDVDDPRGGVRNVIPALGNYLKREGGDGREGHEGQEEGRRQGQVTEAWSGAGEGRSPAAGRGAE